jgi:hypothetical protein
MSSLDRYACHSRYHYTYTGLRTTTGKRDMQILQVLGKISRSGVLIFMPTAN